MAYGDINGLLERADAVAAGLDDQAAALMRAAFVSTFNALEEDLLRGYANLRDTNNITAQNRALILLNDLGFAVAFDDALAADFEEDYTRLLNEASALGRDLSADVEAAITNQEREGLLGPAIPIEQVAAAASGATERLKGHGRRFAQDAAILTQQGLIQGWSNRRLAQNIQRRLGTTIGEANRIARTETMAAVNTAALTTYQENGSDKWQRVPVLDGRVCQWCRARAFNVYEIQAAAEVLLHPFDRCFAIPWRDEWVHDGIIDLKQMREWKEQVDARSEVEPEFNQPAPFERMNGTSPPVPHLTFDDIQAGRTPVPEPIPEDIAPQVEPEPPPEPTPTPATAQAPTEPEPTPAEVTSDIPEELQRVGVEQALDRRGRLGRPRSIGDSNPDFGDDIDEFFSDIYSEPTSVMIESSYDGPSGDSHLVMSSVELDANGLYEYGFLTNGTFDAGTIPPEDSKIAVEIIREQYRTIMRELPDGAIVVNTPWTSDGKGGGRQAAYMRQGFGPPSETGEMAAMKVGGNLVPINVNREAMDALMDDPNDEEETTLTQPQIDRFRAHQATLDPDRFDRPPEEASPDMLARREIAEQSAVALDQIRINEQQQAEAASPIGQEETEAEEDRIAAARRRRENRIDALDDYQDPVEALFADGREHRASMSPEEADTYTAGTIFGGPQYHGTSARGAVSIAGEGVNPDVNSRAVYGRGFYVTPDGDTAADFAELADDEGGRVMDLRILARNPRRFADNKEFERFVAEDLQLDPMLAGGQGPEWSREVSAQFRALGFDSIRIEKMDYTVVFDERQVVVTRDISPDRAREIAEGEEVGDVTAEQLTQQTQQAIDQSIATQAQAAAIAEEGNLEEARTTNFQAVAEGRQADQLGQQARQQDEAERPEEYEEEVSDEEALIRTARRRRRQRIEDAGDDYVDPVDALFADGRTHRPSMTREEADAYTDGTIFQTSQWHGTSRGGARSISEDGVLVDRNSIAGYGQGFYMGGKSEIAGDYAETRGGGGGRVLELRVMARNPKRFADNPAFEKFVAEELGLDSRVIGQGDEWAAEVTAQFRSLGFDSVRIEGSDYTIAFDPRQVVVVDNISVEASFGEEEAVVDEDDPFNQAAAASGLDWDSLLDDDDDW